jgi:serine/threonine protein kinase/dipeptidyl aminopeptidase/acylaminoacyl peptidase
MAVAEVHPSVEELRAFTLGKLDDKTQGHIEDHVAACTSCLERAAAAPDDNFVELLRRAHSRGDDTSVVLAAQVETPVPVEAADEGVTPAAVALSMLAESDSPEILDAIPPELVGHERYRVVRRIGSGGMGEVYLAEHLVMKRPVALKVIRRDYTARADALERFRDEVHKAGRLAHPNIVTTYDAEDAGETHFLAMEYVEGIDLGRLVQERGPLRVDRACDYVRQAALGLQYAFKQGMVHRDLKPHNLMLAPGGCVKILDFGLARFASEAAATTGGTTSGIVLGTVDYIAPEQADSSRQADIRSDIYSLGCTLYHLLAGHPPFPTGTALQKVMAHVEKKPQPLNKLRPDLPEEIMPVLERMMAKNPKDRYPSPIEVARALEPFTRATAGTRAPQSRPPARKADPGRTAILKESPAKNKRRPRFAIAAALLAFVTAGLLGAAVYHIATDKGELVITTESDDVKVIITQGGKQVDVVDTKTDKQIRLALRSGEYELELKGAPEGLKLDIKSAKLTRGETVLATITRTEVTRANNSGVALTEPAPAKKPPDGVVAWWRADGDAKDSVGDNHGELKGGVTFAPGVADKAFRLDGATRYVEVPRNDRWGFGRRDFSIELWVQFRMVAPPNDIDHPSAIFIGCDERPGTCNKWLFAYSAGFINFYIVNANGKGGVYAKADFSPDLDQWYHLAVTRSQGTFTIYVDGVPVASQKADIIIPNPDAPLTIGQATGAGFVSGLIDEVAIYDRALSPAEVKARWKELAPTTTKEVGEKVGEVRRFRGHEACVHSVAISTDGKLAASGSGGIWTPHDWIEAPDYSVRLWDMASGREIRRFEGHGSAVTGLAFSPDGSLLASAGSHDRTVRIWEVATGKQLHCLRGDNAKAFGVAFLSDGRHVISGHDDGFLRLWDVKTGEQVRKFEGHQGGGWSVRVSPDGRRIASGWDKIARVWDAETGKELHQFPGHTHGLESVAFSPDGHRLLTADPPGKVFRLWDVESGKELRQFVGHTDEVKTVAFTKDGRRALSGSFDETIRLWDVETGKELHRFTDHTSGVFSIALSPDGRYALSGSNDKTVRLWRLPDPPPAKENP